MKRIFLIVIVLLFIVLTAGCADDKTDSEELTSAEENVTEQTDEEVVSTDSTKAVPTPFPSMTLEEKEQMTQEELEILEEVLDELDSIDFSDMDYTE